jgi:hypothetical protein
VEVNFACAMANHHHTGIHDPEGNYPIFAEHFHGLLARCQNAHLGRFENFWSSEPTSVVRLLKPEDVLDKLVYAYSNPPVADLVETADEWPGVSTLQATFIDGELTATRPAHYFRDDGDMPETVTLKIHRPRTFIHLTQNEWAEKVTLGPSDWVTRRLDSWLAAAEATPNRLGLHSSRWNSCWANHSHSGQRATPNPPHNLR